MAVQNQMPGVKILPKDGDNSRVTGDGRKRAALFFYEGYIAVQPTVISAIEQLIQNGYEIDLYYAKPFEQIFEYPGRPGLKLFECPLYCRTLAVPVQRLLNIVLRAFQKISSPHDDSAILQPVPAARRWGLRLAAEIFEFGMFCRRRFRGADFTIAFDMTGLAGMNLAVGKDLPFIYWSLEILLLEEATDPTRRALRKMEMLKLPAASAIAVQSQGRAELLTQGTSVLRERVAIVPNAPTGPLPVGLSRDFFIHRFGISPAKTIVLHAGMIRSFVRSVEIAASVRSWDEKFTMVFHTHEHLDPRDAYLCAVREAGGPRVLLSLDPVASNRVDEIFAGAHIGLVAYAPIDVNSATAYSSSGKLAYYLRHGIPVVILAEEDFPLVREQGVGICVKDAAEIAGALQIISEDYAQFSSRAKKCFAEMFDFHVAFNRLIAIAESHAPGGFATSSS